MDANAVQPVFRPLGDSAVVLEWPGRPDAEQQRLIASAFQRISAADFPGVRGAVPGFESLAVFFDPLSSFAAQSCEVLTELLQQTFIDQNRNSRLLRIPVSFRPEDAPDLAAVAAAAGISMRDVIDKFTAAEFEVRIIGFNPGFPYLTGLPKLLSIPRRSSPRLRVPGGSVAIAGEQAGIYPVASPGGWHVIGRTQFQLFDEGAMPPCQLSPGDRVRFDECNESTAGAE